MRSNGRVTGNLSYGQIEVERGGEIQGQITSHGKQPVLRQAQENALHSVSNERRAIAAAPAPVARMVRAADVPPAPRPQKAEETAAPDAGSLGEAAARSRKTSFFGR